jgi:hypothetical protein
LVNLKDKGASGWYLEARGGEWASEVRNQIKSSALKGVTLYTSEFDLDNSREDDQPLLLFRRWNSINRPRSGDGNPV